MASNLLSRMWLAFRAGIQFAGKRNLYEVFGYPRLLTPEILLGKYQRQDISARIVDMPPEEMWSLPPGLLTPDEFKDLWTAFAKKTKLWQRIIQADKLCAFGKFSVLWVGLPGKQDEPVRTTTDLNDILYMQAYGGSNAQIMEYEDDTTNPRYGQPTLYRVTVGPAQTQASQNVHYTRIIHIVDRPLQGLMFGEPRLAQIYNVLDDMLKVGGGCAETFWLTANRGMQVDVDKDMELKEEDANALSDELDEFQHQLRRYVRTRGVKMKTLGSDSIDPTGVYSVLLNTLSGATSIPQRILIGAEAGQLASEQDRANWSEYIRRRRTTFGEPYVLNSTLQYLELIGYAPKGTAENATWKWPEAFQLNPLEEAQTLASKGRAVANLSTRGRFGSPIITDEESRRMIGLPDKPAKDETLPEVPAGATNTPSTSPTDPVPPLEEPNTSTNDRAGSAADGN